MFTLFGYVNEVEFHNKSRKSDLVLDKFWDTQCGCIMLCKTVSMGMTITNFYKKFCYVVNRDHHEKLIGIR